LVMAVFGRPDLLLSFTTSIPLLNLWSHR